MTDKIKSDYKKLKKELFDEYNNDKLTCLAYGSLMEKLEECEKHGIAIDEVSIMFKIL